LGDANDAFVERTREACDAARNLDATFAMKWLSAREMYTPRVFPHRRPSAEQKGLQVQRGYGGGPYGAIVIGVDLAAVHNWR